MIEHNNKYIYAVLILTIFGSIFFYGETAYSQPAVEKQSNEKSEKKKADKNDKTQSTAKQSDSLSANISDSLSINTSDSTEAAKDTIVRMPFSRHGRTLLLKDSDYMSISKRDIQFANYSSVSDLIYEFSDVYPLSLGMFGQFNSFSFLGGMPRDVSINYDSRIISDPAFGSYNPEQIPTETFENIEIFIGSEAVILSDNSSGALLNIQEAQHNTKTPYTRIFFSQAGYEYLNSDGTFSQNFARDWNITAGFRNVSTVGRFSNSELESWNVRGILRWSPSDRTTFSLTENFTHHFIGTGGGVSIDNSYDLNNDGNIDVYDALEAQPVFPRSDKRAIRHDLTLKVSSLLSADSSEAFSGSIFLSNTEWDNYTFPVTIDDTTASHYQKYNSSYYGAEGKFEENLNEVLYLAFGGNGIIYNVPGTSFSDPWNGLSAAAFGYGVLSLHEGLDLSGGVRFKSIYGNNMLSYGAGALFKLSGDMKIKADLSLSDRFPTPVEGFGLDNERHLLGLVNFNWAIGSAMISGSAFARYIHNPILAEAVFDTSGALVNSTFKNEDSREIIGGSLTYSNDLINGMILDNDRVHIRVKIQTRLSTAGGINDNRFPAFAGSVDSYYQMQIQRSILIVGFSFYMQSAFNGEQYVPQTRAYIPYAREKAISINGIDAYLKTRLGNAYVRITYQNLLSSGYYYVPVYPQLDGNMRITISWSFFD